MNRRHSVLEEEPCRHCTSFSDYAKVARRKAKAENNSQTGKITKHVIPQRNDCPLDREQIGRYSWGLLHTIAATYPKKPSIDDKNNVKQFFTAFSKLYPCNHCAEHFRNVLKDDPPQVSSQDDFSQWLCRIHNKVNVDLGKEEFDCSKVNERWRDGWLDGSCG